METVGRRLPGRPRLHHRPVPAIVEALRLRRLHLGWSQAQVAEMIGVSMRAVMSWECGSRSPDARMLSAYAAALDTQLSVGPPPLDVDQVKVRRYLQRQLPWAELNADERLTAYTTLRARRWTRTRISREYGLSGDTVFQLEVAMASREAAA